MEARLWGVPFIGRPLNPAMRGIQRELFYFYLFYRAVWGSMFS
jgi:hypothetical protein